MNASLQRNEQKETGLVRVGELSLLPGNATTPQDLAIIRAMTDRRISEVTDVDLNDRLSACINKGAILLGHKNQLTDPKDLAILIVEINRMIRQRWSFYTLKELELVFDMGVRGELRARPDQVVFINIEQVNGWFQVYRHDRKPRAVQSATVPEPEPAEVNPIGFLDVKIAFLKSRVELAKEGKYEDFDTGNVYSDWLQQLGLIRLSNAEKLAIKFEEAKRMIANAKVTDLDFGSRWELKRFMRSKSMLRENRYELRLRSLCKKRILKDFIARVIEQDLDIQQLISERLSRPKTDPQP